MKTIEQLIEEFEEGLNVAHPGTVDEALNLARTFMPKLYILGLQKAREIAEKEIAEEVSKHPGSIARPCNVVSTAIARIDQELERIKS